jgi:uncharacterized protein
MDYLIPGFLGFLTGAALFGLTYSKIFPPIERLAKIGNVVMPDLWNLSPFLFILLFGLIALLLFYLIERLGLERKNKVSE